MKQCRRQSSAVYCAMYYVHIPMQCRLRASLGRELHKYILQGHGCNACHRPATAATLPQLWQSAHASTSPQYRELSKLPPWAKGTQPRRVNEDAPPAAGGARAPRGSVDEAKNGYGEQTVATALGCRRKVQSHVRCWVHGRV